MRNGTGGTGRLDVRLGLVGGGRRLDARGWVRVRVACGRGLRCGFVRRGWWTWARLRERVEVAGVCGVRRAGPPRLPPRTVTTPNRVAGI